MLNEQFACCIQPHPAWQAFKQWLSQLVLNSQNAAVQGGGGDGQLVRRLPYGPFTRNNINETQTGHIAHSGLFLS